MRWSPLVLVVAFFAAADAGADTSASQALPAPERGRSSSCAPIDVADAALDPHDAKALFARLERVADAGCGASLSEWLEASRCASSTTNVVAGAAFASEAFATRAMNAILARAVDRAEGGEPACAKQVLPAAQQAARVDEGTRQVLLRAARSSDPQLSEAGWLVLGTAESIARAHDDALAGAIDADLASALSGATGDARTTLLEAAGNGGCRSCAASVDAARADADPWVRRAAITADRFVPERAHRMCDALEDPNATVRDQARWAAALVEIDCQR